MAGMQEMFNVAMGLAEQKRPRQDPFVGGLTAFLQNLPAGMKFQQDRASAGLDSEIKRAAIAEAQNKMAEVQKAQELMDRYEAAGRVQARANAVGGLNLMGDGSPDRSLVGKVLSGLDIEAPHMRMLRADQEPDPLKDTPFKKMMDVSGAMNGRFNDPDKTYTMELGPNGRSLRVSDRERPRQLSPIEIEEKQSEINQRKAYTEWLKAGKPTAAGGGGRTKANPMFAQAENIAKYYIGLTKDKELDKDLQDQARELAQAVKNQQIEFLAGERDTFDLQPMQLQEVEEPGKLYGTNKARKFVPVISVDNIGKSTDEKRIKARRTDGKVGTILLEDFDPSKYTKI